MGNDARARILGVASKLFYKSGVRAVGIDRIIADSGVAKATFYRHFPAKADLVEATLRARDEATREWLTSAAARRAAEARISPAIALFEILGDWLVRPDFHGCAFVRAMLDSDGDVRICQLARTHKQAIENWLAAQLAVDTDDATAATTARALMLIFDGAIVRAQIEEDRASVASAASIAAAVMLKERA